MTVASAAAVGALALAVPWRCALLLVRGAWRHRVHARLPERRPAREGRRRPGRRPARSARCATSSSRTTTRRAIKIAVQEPYAPLREGTQAVDPPDVAVGHRQPLRRAHARRPTPPGAAPTARRSATDSTTDVVDLDQIFNTLDPKTRGRPAGRHQGLRHASTTGKGPRPARRPKYFNPLAVDLAPAVAAARPRTRAR